METEVTVNEKNEVVITKPRPTEEAEVQVATLSKLLGFRENYNKYIADLQAHYDTEMPKLLAQRAENEGYIETAIAGGAKTDEEVKAEEKRLAEEVLKVAPEEADKK